MAETLINDDSVERRIPIAGVPANVNSSFSASASVPTSTIQSFTITVTAGMRYLSMWNYALTVRVGTDDDDHVWPTGSALTASQRTLDVFNYQDWAASNDTTNKPVFRLHIRNFSGDTHTIYIKFKTYTFAYITGSAA